jgi:hypothetical protein
MEDAMGRISWLPLVAFGLLAGLNPSSAAPETTPADLLRDETLAKVPPNWQVHVSWRDNALVVFLMPPYQEAFDLWYEPEKLRDKMLQLCPGPTDVIWAKLPADRDVAIEPTVGGKSAVAMRLTCKRAAPPPA